MQGSAEEGPVAARDHHSVEPGRKWYQLGPSGAAQQSDSETLALRFNQNGLHYACSSINHRGPFHEDNDRTVRFSLEVWEVMFDIFQLSQLTRPAAVGQLSGGRASEAVPVREECDFLKAGLRFFSGANFITERDEGLLQSGHGLLAWQAGRPGLFAARVGPSSRAAVA